MADLKWLKNPAGRSTDALIALEGEYRIDSIVLAFEQALSAKPMDELTDAEGVVCAVAALEREVNSNGFFAFFEHCAEWTPHIVAALELIGRPDVARVAANAFAALGCTPDANEDVLEDALAALDEDQEDALEACDDEYGRVAGDLFADLFGFIKRERANIRLGAR